MTLLARLWDSLRPILGPDNPVFAKELRTRMRGKRAFVILGLYSAALSLILFITYLEWWRYQRSNETGAYTVGERFYSTLFILQGILVAVLTPALTAGGVSIEREQRTYELLSVSLLSRSAIIWGKLAAATLFVGLLLVASLPLASVGFLLGGVSPEEILTASLLLWLTALLYGAVGLACSSVAKNTTQATLSTYSTIAGLFFVTLPLTLMITGSRYGSGARGAVPGVGLTALNPVGALGAGGTYEMYFGITTPAWLSAALLNGFLAVIFATLAVHRMEYPRSDRAGRLRALVAVFVLVAGFCVYGISLPGNNMQWFGSSSAPRVALGAPAFITWGFAFLMLSIFALSDGLPEERLSLFRWFSPARLRRGEATSGLIYCLLLVGICGAVMYAGAKWGPGRAQFATLAPLITRTLLITFATVWGWGMLSVFLSAATKKRNWSSSVLLLLLIVSVLTPSLWHELRRGSGLNVVHWQPGVWENVLYVSPIQALFEATDSNERATLHTQLKNSPMLAGKTELWKVNALLNVFAGLVWLTLLGRVVSKRANKPGNNPSPAPQVSPPPPSPNTVPPPA